MHEQQSLHHAEVHSSSGSSFVCGRNPTHPLHGTSEGPMHASSNNPPWDARLNQDQGDKCFLVVECSRPFRVVRADPLWLQHFGFRSVEVEGRSMYVCFGPETDSKAITELLQTAVDMASDHDRSVPGIWSKVKLYNKTGHVQDMLVRARLECTDDGQNGQTPTRVRLLMESDTGTVSPSVSRSHVPMVNLCADEPFQVVHYNQAFIDLYQIEATGDIEMSLIWGPATDGRRWKSLIHQALDGAAKTCTLCTYSGEGDEIVVQVTIMPNEAAGFSTFGRFRPLELTALFVPLSWESYGNSSHDSGCKSPCGDQDCFLTPRSRPMSRVASTTSLLSAASTGSPASEHTHRNMSRGGSLNSLTSLVNRSMSRGSSFNSLTSYADDKQIISDSLGVALHAHIKALRSHKHLRTSGALEHLGQMPKGAN